jgi:hypothetical protein
MAKEGTRGVNGLNRPNLNWLLILASAGLSLFVFACGGGADVPEGVAPGGDTAATQDEELPTLEMPSLWAWGDAERLDTLIASADVVFTGNVLTLKGQRPVLSQPGGAEPEAPGPRWADIPVSEFEVQVESVVAGNLAAGTVVPLEQLGGVETMPDGSRVRLALEGDEPIQVGQTYLLFASFQENGSIVASPFGRLKVQANGGLAAEQDWAHLGALQQLSRMRLGDAERQIGVAAGE